MIISGWMRHARRTLLATGATLTLTAGVLGGTASTSQAATRRRPSLRARAAAFGR